MVLAKVASDVDDPPSMVALFDADGDHSPFGCGAAVVECGLQGALKSVYKEGNGAARILLAPEDGHFKTGDKAKFKISAFRKFHDVSIGGTRQVGKRVSILMVVVGGASLPANGE